MIYNYYFDVASVIASLFLISLYMLRKTYRTKANIIFVLLLVFDFLGAGFDIVSCYSICFPERYPMWFNYLTTLGYLFFYNMMGVMFFLYLDAKTKIGVVMKPVKVFASVVIVGEGVAIFSSPYTHWIAYFDESMQYSHGPYMSVLYIVAGTLLAMGVGLFVARRRKFNKYQVIAICAFVVAVFVGVLVQMVMPSLLVGEFACTLVLFFIYVSLENPVYYTYIGTTCYNRFSFLETMRYRSAVKKNSNMYTFIVNDFELIRGNLGLRDMERLSSNIAAFINLYYGNNAFCIADDKFVILFDDTDEEPVIHARINQYFAKPIALAYSTITVNINRIVIYDVHSHLKSDIIETGVNYLLEHSEKELYCEHNFQGVVDKIERKRSISSILKESIQENSFEIYYQPIRNVALDKFTSVEALIRLKNKKYGFISPEEFIPIAESEGLVLPIGEIVFEKVCQFIKETNCIRELGVNYIEINLSPLQCYQENLASRFKEIMERYQVDPTWINLEITETASLERSDKLQVNLTEMHHMGMSFSLDDYGSGFASIDYLFKLPVEIVKLDKIILWTAMKDENAKIVLIHTLKMLQELGKKIVVEGVEDENMVALLEANGVDYMQGYFYSKPLPQEDYVQFLKEKNV